MKDKKYKKFEADMQKLVERGHFIKIQTLSNNSGIEMFLSPKVDYYTANNVSYFLKNTYGVNSIFFVKNHSIKVLYDVRK